MDNSTERLAVCSVITKNYIEYLRVFCSSLLRHNPEFDRDYVIFYRDGDLNKTDFQDLKKLYKKFVFLKIPEENYSILDDDSTFKGSLRGRLIRKLSYARIEMFSLTQYSQVIYFDIDMLVMRSLKSLFSMRYDDGIIACEDKLVKIKNLATQEEYEKNHKVQGGLIVVGKNLINIETYNELIGMLDRANEFDMCDQTMFSEYFAKNNKLQELDMHYNCGRKIVRDGHVNWKDVFIIHYPGSKKPYDCASHLRSDNCPTFKFWHTERDLIKNE